MMHVSNVLYSFSMRELTISTFLEFIKELRVDAIVRSVPHVVVGVITLPGPLEDDLDEHV